MIARFVFGAALFIFSASYSLAQAAESGAIPRKPDKPNFDYILTKNECNFSTNKPNQPGCSKLNGMGTLAFLWNGAEKSIWMENSENKDMIKHLWLDIHLGTGRYDQPMHPEVSYEIKPSPASVELTGQYISTYAGQSNDIVLSFDIIPQPASEKIFIDRLGLDFGNIEYIEMASLCTPVPESGGFIMFGAGLLVLLCVPFRQKLADRPLAA